MVITLPDMVHSSHEIPPNSPLCQRGAGGISCFVVTRRVMKVRGFQKDPGMVIPSKAEVGKTLQNLDSNLLRNVNRGLGHFSWVTPEDTGVIPVDVSYAVRQEAPHGDQQSAPPVGLLTFRLGIPGARKLPRIGPVRIHDPDLHPTTSGG